MRLTNGTTVPLLRRDLGEGSLYLSYVTAMDMRDHQRVCAEAQAVFRRLAASGDVAAVNEVMLSPTDPRARIHKWTWKGPMYSCCVSIGLAFKKEPSGEWPLWPVGCGESPNY